MMSMLRRLIPPAKKKMQCPICHKGRLVYVSSDRKKGMTNPPVYIETRRYDCPVCGSPYFKTIRTRENGTII